MEKLLNALNTVESGYLRRGLPVFDGREGKCLYSGSSRLVNFSSNDYLGLSSDKEIRRKAAGLLGRTEMRLGSGSARLVSGSFRRYGEIEKIYGNYFGFENSLFFPSGYQANVGLMSALFDPEDSVIVDKRLHASLVHGLSLAKAKLTAFRHADWKSFEKKSLAAGAPRAAVLESLYSMDGDVLDISYIEKNRSSFPFLVVDEAHAFGVLGDGGKGIASHLADIAIGTFGKAFGFHGAFILCSDRVRDYLINFCPSFRYTTSLPLFHYEVAELLLDKVGRMDAERAYLADLSKFAKELLLSQGIPVKGDAHVLAVQVGSGAKAVEIAGGLMRRGCYVFAARYPTTPYNRAILRIGLTAEHEQDDIKSMSDCLKELLG